MSIINKILKCSLLILIAFTLLVPTSTYSHSGVAAENADHSEHTQQSMAAYETTNDCASACAQISRTANPAVTLKQSKSSNQQQSKTESETLAATKEHIEPCIRTVPEPFILPVQEIYKFICAYLL